MILTVILVYLGVLVAIILGGFVPAVAAGAVKPGAAGRVYRNSGSYGSPTWVAVNLVKDATPSMPWDMVEAGARETRAKLYAKARADLSVQLVVRADDADTGFNALADAAVSPTTLLDLLVLDGLISVEGVRGFRAHWNVNLTGQPQDIDNVIYDTFELKPGWNSAGYPSTVIMGATSTPAFTAL